MRSQGETSRRTALPAHWISALFKRFQVRYGNKWTSSVDGIEEMAVREWAQGLADVTGDQIKAGLEAWDDPWPPSLPEFRGVCLGRRRGGKNDLGLDYVPEYHRQPRRVTDPARLLSSDQRKANRERMRAQHMGALKDACKGKGVENNQTREPDHA